jgi:tetratricopeptide (TPR) repeat protein
MPYRDIGVVKNATKQAMVNLEFGEGKATVKVFTTSINLNARILLKIEDKILLEELFDFHPGNSYEKSVPILDSVDPKLLKIEIIPAGNKLLVDWQPEPDQHKAIPEAAKPAKLPSEIEQNEQLYLTALHLEQYRHANYDPRDYYHEALRRDPNDSRCNIALGLWYLRRGQFTLAESYFSTAVGTITQRNPNPIDGEVFFNLGVARLFMGKVEEAYESFYKATWNAAWMENSYFQLARIATKRGNWEEGLDLINRSLLRNWHNHKARQLKASILRKLSRNADAKTLIEDSLKLDPFNVGVQFEKHLQQPDSDADLSGLKSGIRGNIHTYLEFALDFAAAGLFEEAIELIDLGIREQKDLPVYPLAWYFKAWFSEQKGNPDDASSALQAAAAAAPEYCFPNQPEAVVVLEWAKKKNPADAKAPYYLGNLWYHHRQYAEAIENWELSARLDDSFPTVHRNLALACFNKLNDPEKALTELKRAFELDPADARILMELDQLYKRLNFAPGIRLDTLKKFPHLVDLRDDLYLEQVTLLNTLGSHEKALELLSCRKFHPWEGGEGKVTSQYVYSLTELGKQAIAAKRHEDAVSRLQAAFMYPDNLGEGKLYGAQENALFYWLGCAYQGVGNTPLAHECWQKASTGISEPLPAIFYNDQQPDTIFYQGLAFIQLNLPEQARQRFETLVNFGTIHLDDPFKLDYFAVSMPDLQIWNDDLTKRNRQNCQRLIELGREGLRQLKD